MKELILTILVFSVLAVSGCSGETSIFKNDDWEKDVNVGDFLICKNDLNDPFEESVDVEVIEKNGNYLQLLFIFDKGEAKISSKRDRLHERGCILKEQP